MPRSSKIPVIVIFAPWPPEVDLCATAILSLWADSACQRFTLESRFEVVRLFGGSATHDGIERTLSEYEGQHGLVVFYGHGCSCGHSLLERLIDAGAPEPCAAINGDNCQLLKNKIVYVVACHSARVLGGSAVSNGAVCYLGYRREMIASIEDRPVQGLQDCVNAGFEVLAQPGRTCQDAWKAIRDAYEETAVECFEKGLPFDGLALRNGLDAFSSPLGNAGATLLI